MLISISIIVGYFYHHHQIPATTLFSSLKIWASTPTQGRRSSLNAKKPKVKGSFLEVRVQRASWLLFTYPIDVSPSPFYSGTWAHEPVSQISSFSPYATTSVPSFSISLTIVTIILTQQRESAFLLGAIGCNIMTYFGEKSHLVLVILQLSKALLSISTTRNDGCKEEKKAL